MGSQRVRQDLVTEQQLGKRAPREASPIALKLQLVRWTPWNLSDLTQDGHKNKTLFYVVLDHRGLCGSALVIFRVLDTTESPGIE